LKSLYSERYRRLLKYLVAARKASGLSQQAVADKLERPQSFVSKYESGERRLDVVELLILADVIGFNANHVVRLLLSRPEIPRKLRKRR
jgi:transcriptional regulator with XRE-family HTH domain